MGREKVSMRQKNSSILSIRGGLVLLALLLCFTACGKKNTPTGDVTTPAPTGTEEPTGTPSPTPTVAFVKTAYETAGREDVYRLPIVSPDPMANVTCIQTAGDYAMFSVTRFEETDEGTVARMQYALCRPLISKQIKYLDPGFSAGVVTLFADGSFLMEDWQNQCIRLYNNRMDEVRSWPYDSEWSIGNYLGEADGCYVFFVMNMSRVSAYLCVPKDGGEAVIKEQVGKIDASSSPAQYPHGWETFSDSSMSATWYLHAVENDEEAIVFQKSRFDEALQSIDHDMLCSRAFVKFSDETEAREFRLYDLSKGMMNGVLSETELAEKWSVRADGILSGKAVIMIAEKADGATEVLLWVPEAEPEAIKGFGDFTKDKPTDCLTSLVKELQKQDILITPDILESGEDVAFSEVMYEIDFANQFGLARATTPEIFPEGMVHPENMRNNGSGHYEFQPHVMSKFYVQEHGEARRQALFNFVDALRAGEEWFECPDEDTMWWCRGRLGHFFYPVEEWYTFCGAYKDGKGQIVRYAGTTQEEFEQKRDEFERMVIDIVNDAVLDDYNDIEKALALYEFLTEYCTYDYEMLNHMSDQQDRQGGYRALIEKKGICNEFACLYQYLLLQCGVDVEESGGPSVTYGQDSHAWVYVTIDGKGYLIDPTWGETSDRRPILKYFLFTDELRESRDGFRASEFDVAGHGEDSRKVYSFEANDNRFEGLWDGTYVAMDRGSKNIYFLDSNGRLCAFYYGE